MSRKDVILTLLGELEMLIAWIPTDDDDARLVKARAREMVARYRKGYPNEEQVSS